MPQWCISANGEVDILLVLEAPQDRKRLESFLGLAVYFADYIPYFSWIATPLFKCLCRKDLGFAWGEDQKQAFELVKLSQPLYEATQRRAKLIDCIRMCRTML